MLPSPGCHCLVLVLRNLKRVTVVFKREAVQRYWRVGSGIHLWFVSQIFFFLSRLQYGASGMIQRYLQVYGGKISIL